jgi:hypothetical protein
LAIRAAMLHLGADLLEKVLGADTGYRGPGIDCGQGHSAEFVSYRDKHIDTVLGRITARRADYHCGRCKRGVVPRDDELGVTGVSLSPGLRRMTARVAAAQPFAKASGLLAELAGIGLSTKRVERSAEAEADGAAAEHRIRAESRAIADGTEQLPLTEPNNIAERATALAYFTTNAQRMRYAYFRDLGMFVGSGAVEAGCKAVVGQRLKLSGMRWNLPGATSILTLRCHQASNRFDHIWSRPHNQTPTALTA